MGQFMVQKTMKLPSFDTYVLMQDETGNLL